MKVLIVEDNAGMREMIKRMVGDLADEISECEDGNQALAAYEGSCPDWVECQAGIPKSKRHFGKFFRQASCAPMDR